MLWNGCRIVNSPRGEFRPSGLEADRYSPANPGSIRAYPCSVAQRSIDSDTSSSISGTRRASRLRSIDLTYVLQLSHASTRTPVCGGAVKDGSLSGSSSPHDGQRMRPTCQVKAHSAQWSIRSDPSPVPGPGGMRREAIQSEERRVGKEWRSGRWARHYRERGEWRM